MTRRSPTDEQLAPIIREVFAEMIDELPPTRAEALADGAELVDMQRTSIRSGGRIVVLAAACLVLVGGLALVASRRGDDSVTTTPLLSTSTDEGRPPGSAPTDVGSVPTVSAPPPTTPGTEPPTQSTLLARLTEELGGRAVSIVETANGIEVRLHAADVALAEDIVDRYGKAVRVVLGALPYPPTDEDVTCPSLEYVGSLSDIGIEVEGPLPSIQTTERDNAAFVATVTNRTETSVTFTGSVGNIATANGQLLTEYPMIALAADEYQIPPGGSAQIPGTLSLASCDPDVGYRIAPGNHWVVLSFYGNRDDPGWRRSEPVEVTILP